MDTILRCPLCSRLRNPADARGVDWSSYHRPGCVVYVCGPCTRAHLVDLECDLLDPARGGAPAEGTVSARRGSRRHGQRRWWMSSDIRTTA